MTDSSKRAVSEAEGWLASARQTLVESHDDEARANVACAQSIHAIIRANDALSLKFLGVKASRHDDLPGVFSKIVRQGSLKPEDARFSNLLYKAVADKSGADYGKKSFSIADAEKYVGAAQDFVSMAKARIGDG